jgi:hypothetical protein
MLKKYIFRLILKKCTVERVWTDRAGPEKLGPQAGRAGIFRPEDMGQAGQVCDFDGRVGPRD